MCIRDRGKEGWRSLCRTLAELRHRTAAGECIAGKSLDDRAGVAALVICAAELAASRHCAHIYFVASVQEEVGLRGAITAAYGIVPDLAVAIDVTFGESPGLNPPEVFIKQVVDI